MNLQYNYDVNLTEWKGNVVNIYIVFSLSLQKPVKFSSFWTWTRNYGDKDETSLTNKREILPFLFHWILKLHIFKDAKILRAHVPDLILQVCHSEDLVDDHLTNI